MFIPIYILILALVITFFITRFAYKKGKESESKADSLKRPYIPMTAIMDDATRNKK
jgi:flagellar basal body-associated protein FliL